MSELTDQLLHAVWAAGVVLPIGLMGPSALSGSLTALALCLPRELVDQWHGWPIGKRKILDILCFAIGGALTGLLIGASNG